MCVTGCYLSRTLTLVCGQTATCLSHCGEQGLGVVWASERERDGHGEGAEAGEGGGGRGERLEEGGAGEMRTRGERESRAGAGGSRYGGKIKRGTGAGRDGESGRGERGRGWGCFKTFKNKVYWALVLCTSPLKKKRKCTAFPSSHPSPCSSPSLDLSPSVSTPRSPCVFSLCTCSLSIALPPCHLFCRLSCSFFLSPSLTLPFSHSLILANLLEDPY